MATVYLAKGRQKRVEEGHPWIYQTEIERVEGEFSPGDVVDVADHRGRFLARGYINPRSTIAVRIFTRRPEEIDRDFFRRRILSAWEFRQRIFLPGQQETDALRVIYGEADFLPGLIVDKFADYLVVQTLTLGIDRWKPVLVDLLQEILQPKGIFERNDASVRLREGLDLSKGWLSGEGDPRVVIQEHGLRFYVDLAGGQKTGYYLDQRENRAAIRHLVSGARVLDCFCYTGAFALHAAKYGAREVLGIDFSEEAVNLARENASLNGLADRCAFFVGNAFDELRSLERSGAAFDVIVLDPPAFTKSRATLENALRGYKEINLRAMRLLPRGGFLVTCCCSYHVSESLFLEVVRDAARDARRALRLVELRRQAPDHPVLLGYDESYYLKCLILQVL